MTIPVVCDDCFYQFQAPDKALGRAIKCPECGSAVRVSKPDDATARRSAPTQKKRSTQKDSDSTRPIPRPTRKSRPVLVASVLLSVVAVISLSALGITLFVKQRARQNSIQELTNADEAIRLQAVKDLGDDALPELVERLKDPDPNVRRQTLQLLRGLGSKAGAASDDIAALAKDSEITVQKEVAKTLASVVADKNALVDKLASLLSLDDETISQEAIPLLQNIPGEQVSSLLLDVVRTKQVPLQKAAVAALAVRPRPSAEVVNVLETAEKNAQEEDLKEAIGGTLLRWGVLTDLELQRVVQLLTGERPNEKRQIGAVLTDPKYQLTKDGETKEIRQITQATDQALQDRIAACQALANCSPKSATGLKALIWALIADVLDVKIAAADALGNFGDLSALALPALARERESSLATVRNQMLKDKTRLPQTTTYMLNAEGEVISINGGIPIRDKDMLEKINREQEAAEWKNKYQPLLEKLNTSLDEALRRSDPTKKLQEICNQITGKDSTDETRLQAIDEISRLPSAQRLAFLDPLLSVYFDYYSHPSSEQLRQNYRKHCQAVLNAADNTLTEDLQKQLRSGDKTERALAVMMLDVLQRTDAVPLEVVVDLFKEALKSSPTDGYAVVYLRNRFNLDPVPRIVDWLKGRSDDIRPAVPLLATIVMSPRRANLLIRRDAWLLLTRTDKTAAIQSAGSLLESATKTERGEKPGREANEVVNDMLEPIASFGKDAQELSPVLERIGGDGLEQQVKLLTVSALVSAMPREIIQKLFHLSCTSSQGRFGGVQLQSTGEPLPVFLQAFERIGSPAAAWLVETVKQRNYGSDRLTHAMTILAKMNPEHVSPFVMDLIGEVNRKGGPHSPPLNTERLLETITRLPNLPPDTLDKLIEATIDAYNSSQIGLANGPIGNNRQRLKRNEFAPNGNGTVSSNFKPNIPAGISGLAETIRTNDRRDILVRSLADKVQSKSRGALLILAALGRDGREAVAALSQIATSEGESPERWFAIYTLGSIGPDAKESVPKLVSLFKSDKSFNQSHRIALQSLLEISAEDAVAVLTSLLRRPSRSSDADEVRQAAIGFAPSLRPFAEDLVPLLTTDIRNDKLSPMAQTASARLLRSIDPPRAVEIFAADFAADLKTVKLKKGKDILPEAAYAQISMLVECGQDGANPVPHLLQIATDKTPFGLMWAREDLSDENEIATVQSDYPELYETMREQSADNNERMNHDKAVRDCRVTAWRALAILPPDNAALSEAFASVTQDLIGTGGTKPDKPSQNADDSANLRRRQYVCYEAARTLAVVVPDVAADRFVEILTRDDLSNDTLRPVARKLIRLLAEKPGLDAKARPVLEQISKSSNAHPQLVATCRDCLKLISTRTPVQNQKRD